MGRKTNFLILLYGISLISCIPRENLVLINVTDKKEAIELTFEKSTKIVNRLRNIGLNIGNSLDDLKEIDKFYDGDYFIENLSNKIQITVNNFSRYFKAGEIPPVVNFSLSLGQTSFEIFLNYDYINKKWTVIKTIALGPN